MEIGVALLAIGSAALHPLKELFIKRNDSPEALCLGMMATWACCAGLHTLYLGIDFWSVAAIWPYALISGSAIFFYHFFIIVALKGGDLSVYYPIARSYPLMIVVIGVLFLGHSYSLSVLGGIALVLAGAFLLQFKPGGKLIDNKQALLGAVLAMTCAAVYSLVDAIAMRHVEPMAFFFWDALVMVVLCLVFFGGTKPPTRPLKTHLFGGWRKAPFAYVAAGVTSYLSYVFILFAYQAGGNVAAVSSIRQASVLFSVILSGLVLKEAGIRNRLIWALVVVGGIVAIIFAR